MPIPPGQPGLTDPRKKKSTGSGFIDPRASGTKGGSKSFIDPRGSQQDPVEQQLNRQVHTMSGSLPGASPFLSKGQFYRDPSDTSNLITTDRHVPVSLITKIRGENKEFEVDHIVPLWLGGTNAELNLQALDEKIHGKKTSRGAEIRARYKRGEISLQEARVLTMNWETPRTTMSFLPGSVLRSPIDLVSHPVEAGKQVYGVGRSIFNFMSRGVQHYLGTTWHSLVDAVGFAQVDIEGKGVFGETKAAKQIRESDEKVQRANTLLFQEAKKWQALGEKDKANRLLRQIQKNKGLTLEDMLHPDTKKSFVVKAGEAVEATLDVLPFSKGAGFVSRGAKAITKQGGIGKMLTPRSLAKMKWSNFATRALKGAGEGGAYGLGYGVAEVMQLEGLTPEQRTELLVTTTGIGVLGGAALTTLGPVILSKLGKLGTKKLKKMTPIELQAEVQKTIKETPVPNDKGIVQTNGGIKVVTNQKTILENYIKNSSRLNYKRVRSLPEGVEARFEWDFKRKQGTVFATKTTTASNLAHELGHFFDRKLTKNFSKKLTDLIPDYKNNARLVDSIFSRAVVHKNKGTVTSAQIAKQSQKLVDTVIDDIDKLADFRGEQRAGLGERFASAFSVVVDDPKQASKIAPEFANLIESELSKAGLIREGKRIKFRELFRGEEQKVLRRVNQQFENVKVADDQATLLKEFADRGDKEAKELLSKPFDFPEADKLIRKRLRARKFDAVNFRNTRTGRPEEVIDLKTNQPFFLEEAPARLASLQKKPLDRLPPKRRKSIKEARTTAAKKERVVPLTAKSRKTLQTQTTNELIGAKKILGQSRVLNRFEILDDVVKKSDSKAAKIFKNYSDVSTVLLAELEGKTTVSKGFLESEINRIAGNFGMKAPERELYSAILKEFPDKNITVTEFAEKVHAALLPLGSVNAKQGGGATSFQSTVLADSIRGDVKDYYEVVYTSPFEHPVRTHFSTNKNYFGHTRSEDLASGIRKVPFGEEKLPLDEARLLGKGGIGDKVGKAGSTRRVIEVQSDLFQKGAIEKTFGSESFSSKLLKGLDVEDVKPGMTVEFRPGAGKTVGSKAIVTSISKDKSLISTVKRGKEAEAFEKLMQYKNIWHERLIKEEVKLASRDGKKKLQIPTGKTIQKIQTGQVDEFTEEAFNAAIARGTKRGDLDVIDFQGAKWVSLGEGPGPNTRALVDIDGFDETVDRYLDEAFEQLDDSLLDSHGMPKNDFADKKIFEIQLELAQDDLIDIAEVITLGGADTGDPIFRFYDGPIKKFLVKRYNAKQITDPQGQTWMEIDIKPEWKNQPVEAFGVVGGVEIDEDGNISLDPTKAAAGILGLKVAKGVRVKPSIRAPKQFSKTQLVTTKAFNPTKVNTSPAVLKTLKQVADQNAQFSSQRGKVTQEQLKAFSLKYLGDENLFKSVPSEIRANIGRMKAAQQTMVDLAGDLTSELQQVDMKLASKQEVAALKEKLFTLEAVTKSFAGARTEASHLFSSLKGEVLQGEHDMMVDMMTSLKKIGLESKTMDDFVAKKHDLFKPTVTDKAFSVWYAAILSGPKTQARNLLSTGFHFTQELANKFLTPTMWNEIPTAFRAMPRGFKEGFVDAKAVLKGDFDAGKFLASGEKIIDRPIKGKFGTMVDFVGRTLNAADKPWFKAAMEVEKSILEKKVKQGKLKLTPAEILEKAQAYGEFVVYRNPPEGAVGALAEGVKSATRKAPLFKIFVPFVRTVANVANRQLDYIPLLNSPRIVNAFLKKGSREGHQALARAWVGMGLTAYAMNEMKGRISGVGPTSYNERQKLMQTGWRPNSVKIGDKWYPYTYFGSLAGVFALAGNINDSIIYNNADDKEVSELVANGMVGWANTVMDMSFLSGVSNLMDLFGRRITPDRYLTNLGAGLVPIPQLYIQTKDIFFQKKSYSPKNLTEKLLYKLGFVENLQPTLDVFGEQIIKDPIFGITPSQVKYDEISRFIRSNPEVKITKPSTTMKIYTQDGEHRVITPQEYTEFMYLTGPEIKAQILNRIESGKFDRVDPVKEVDKIIRAVREEAKEEMWGDQDRNKRTYDRNQ